LRSIWTQVRVGAGKDPTWNKHQVIDSGDIVLSPLPLPQSYTPSSIFFLRQMPLFSTYFCTFVLAVDEYMFICFQVRVHVLIRVYLQANVHVHVQAHVQKQVYNTLVSNTC
jgi:hypothetical protein